MVKHPLRCLGDQQLVVPAKLKSRRSQLTFSLKLKQIWQFLVTTLKVKSELRVWPTCDRKGNIWWSAYEPTSGRSIHQISEAEMLTWIEKQRH